MDRNRLVRIAVRVAAGVQLQGPFNESGKPQNVVEIDIPFGLAGQIAPLLLASWGEDPKNLNAVQQLEKGPISDVPVGYSVTKEDFRKGQIGPSYFSPGDEDEYELEIELTHLGSWELSTVDQQTLNKAGLKQLVLDKVYDKHAQEAAERAADVGGD